MDLAKLSYYAFDIGTICLAISFVLLIVHTTLLAAGRRAAFAGALAGARSGRTTVACLEWLDPPFAAGHWVPEQVRRAGGWELLGRAGEDSARTSWEQVREVDPEVLVLMLCGFDAARTDRGVEDGR